MDGRTIHDEAAERLELRGITPEQVHANPLAYAEYCDVAVDVIDDELTRRGLNPETGQPR